MAAPLDTRYPITRSGSTLYVKVYTSHPYDTANASINRLAIVVHGSSMNPADYRDRLASRLGPNVLVVAPLMAESTESPAADELWWSSGWREGNRSQSQTTGGASLPFRVSSFEILDQLRSDLTARFTNVANVVVGGFSAGGQFVQRYSMTQTGDPKLAFVVGAPSSYAYVNPKRVTATATTVGMYMGWDGSANITSFETTNNISIPLGHEFGDASQWTWFEDGTNFDNWATWVNAKAGRRFSYSAPLLTVSDDSGLTIQQKYAKLAAGDYDVHFTNLGNAFQSRPALRNSIVRLGWEFNGDSRPWAVPPNDQTTLNNFKTGWVRVAKALKAACPTLEIEWCPNCQPDYTLRTFADMYPADDSVIDYIGIGLYDYYWPGGSPTAQQRYDWLVNGDTYNGLQDQVDLAAAKGKKLAHTEWGLWSTSSTGGGGDRPAFITMMADWYEQHGYSYQVYNNTTSDGGHLLNSYPNAKAGYLNRFRAPAATGTGLAVPSNPPAGYDNWKYGLANIGSASVSYVDTLGAQTMRDRLQAAKVTYIVGSLDTGDIGGLDTTAQANVQGASGRLERRANYLTHLADHYGSGVLANHTSVTVPNAGHDGHYEVFNSTESDAVWLRNVGGTLAKTSTLTDDFTTQDTTKWSGWKTGLSVVSGRLRAVADTSYDNFLTSTGTFDLTGSYIEVSLAAVPAAVEGTEAYVSARVDANNSVGFVYGGGSINAQYTVAGVITDLNPSWPAYNATQHQWVRIREASGTFYVETSPDRLAWTVLGSAANPFALTAVQVRLGAANWNAVASPGYAEFDQLNVAAPTGGGGSSGTAGVLFNQPMTGTQGATITTATLAAAGDAPDLFQNPAPAVWFYDNGMGKLEANSTASYLQENVSFAEGQDCVAYIGTWRGSNPPTTMYLLRINNGGSLVARLSLGTDGIMKMYSAVGTEWTGSTPVPQDRKVIHGLRLRLGATAATGALEYRRWEASASTPTVAPDTRGTPAVQVTAPVATGTAATRVQFGNTAASNTASTWFHSLRIADGWEMSSVDATAAPTAVVGATVTLTAVGSPAGGTYAWARAATPGNAPAVTLSGANTATASFTAPAGGGGTTANFTVTYTPPGLPAVTDTVGVQFTLGAKPVVSYVRTEGTVINASATVGTVTLTQITGTGVPVVESPAKVFTIDTTGVDQALQFQLVANDGTQNSDPVFVDVAAGAGGGGGVGDVVVSSERYWNATSRLWEPSRTSSYDVARFS